MGGGAPAMIANPPPPVVDNAATERARRDELYGQRRSAGRQDSMLTAYTEQLRAAPVYRVTTGGQ